jgi:hypothetical protein
MMCPSGRGAHDVAFLGTAIRVAEQKILAALRSQRRHYILSWSELEQASPATNWFNVAGDRLGHVPFTPEGLDRLADFFVGHIGRMPTQTANSRESLVTDLERFLASLELAVTISPLAEANEQRIMDLVRHTTHFINLPGQKLQGGGLRTALGMSSGGQVWVVRVNDRFGDYGISGMVAFDFDREIMRVSLLLLSCPVLGKQVEHVFFAWLAELALRQHAGIIEVPVLRGRDNELLCNLLTRLEGARDGLPPLLPGTERQFLLPVIGLAQRVLQEAPNPAAVLAAISHTRSSEATA